MSSKQNINYTNEIDISEIIRNVWNKKWKIILISALVVLATAVYQKNSMTKYTAETEIKPISNFEQFKYDIYNEFILETNTGINYDNANFLGISIDDKQDFDGQNNSTGLKKMNYRFKGELPFDIIDKKYLLGLFVDAFDDNLLKDLIIKFDLVKKENYENNELYENEILNLASTIKLVKNDKNRKNKFTQDEIPSWNIVFTTSDRLLWINFLDELNDALNLKIKKHLKKVFYKLAETEKSALDYRIDKIEERMKQSLDTYDENIQARLAFLKEQAAIARKLEVGKNTLPSQNFVTENGMISNLQTEMPYYMRGYLMIEKEIQLIENRDEENKKNFANEFKELKRKKIELSSNNSLKRLESLFVYTPIINSNNFEAARIMSRSTVFSSNKKISDIIVLLIASIIGFMIGVIYISLENIIKKGK